MPPTGKIVAAICIVWFLGIAAFDWWQSNLIKLLTMPVSVAYFGAWIASIVCVFIGWRRWRFRAFIPVAVCMATLVVTNSVSPRLMDAGFARVMPRYTALIQQMDGGQMVVSNISTRVVLSGLDAELAYVVWADRETNGVLTATFFVGGGFPVKHWGYLYRSSGENPPRDWWIKNDWMGRRLNDKWFYIFD
ncbi:MAG: hypothetical protein WDN00_13190 [Limisphaerales bacterium]